MKWMVIIISSHLVAGLTINPSDSITLLEGSRLLLTCASPGMQAVQWTHNNKIITQKKVVQSNPNSLDILFPSIAPENNGTYTCLAGIPERNLSSKTLTVHIIPIVDFSNTPNTHLAKKGEDANLSCTIQVSPKPSKVYWTFKGEIIRNSDKYRNTQSRSIIIKNITLNDTGPYTCHTLHLTPEASIVQNKTVLLKTPSKPILTSWSTHPNELVLRDTACSLACSVTAAPSAQFYWYFRENNSTPIIRLKNSSSTQIRNTLNNSTLNLYLLRHFGQYLCRAVNNLGTAEQLFLLRENHPVSAIQSETIINSPPGFPANAGHLRAINNWIITLLTQLICIPLFFHPKVQASQ